MGEKSPKKETKKPKKNKKDKKEKQLIEWGTRIRNWYPTQVRITKIQLLKGQTPIF